MTQDNFEKFDAGFDRSFRRVYAYVSRRVNDRESCQRIVRQVLAANLDLLVNGADGARELSRLKAASDRLIESESAKTRNAMTTSLTDKVEGTGDTTCRESLESSWA